MMSRWSSRGARAALLSAVLTVSGFLVTAAPADAHAVLQESSPADGASLQRAPSEITLRFDEDVDVATTVVRLFDGAGHLLSTGPVHAAEPGADDSTTVIASLPRLTTDRYLVRWRTITSDDFHPVTGTIAFAVGGVGTAPAGNSDARGLGAPLESALRWATLAGFMLVAAGWALLLSMSRLLTLRPKARRAVERTMIGGAALSVAALVGLLSTLTLGVGAPPPDAFVGYWGLAIGCIGGAVAAVQLHATARAVRTAVGAVVAGVGAVLLAGWALTHLGHGAAAEPVAGTVHTLATSVWAGGVALLALVCIPAMRDGANHWARQALARFALVAAPAIVLTAVTGFLMAATLVPASGGLLETWYGRGLIVKSAVAAVAVGTGGLTFLRVRSSQVDGHASRRLVTELCAVVVVVGLAAALSAGQPPDDRRWLPAPATSASSGLHTMVSDDLMLTLTMSPGTPGANFITVGVLDTRRPAPAPIEAVTIAVGDRRPLAAVRQNDTEWLVSQQVAQSGAAGITVRVTRPGYDDESVTFPWQVGPVPGTERGGASLISWWRLAALLAGVAGLLTIVLVRRWRRKPLSAIPAPERTNHLVG